MTSVVVVDDHAIFRAGVRAEDVRPHLGGV